MLTDETHQRAKTSVTPAARFDQVVKRYGDHTVLEVRRGEGVTLIGPSGSGKTTVLRLLMTLERVTEGVVHVDGAPFSHMPGRVGRLVPADEKHLRAERRRIGMVFQPFDLFPHMKVLENVTEAHPALRRPAAGSRTSPAHSRPVYWTLRDIARGTDITLLCVTHETGCARDVSDRVLMFDGGRVVESGAPERIFGSPEHRRTREFLSAVL